MPANHDKLNRTLGSPFANLELLKQAITHRSYRARNNERLEFLGDALLNFTIARELFHLRADDTEGDLSRARATLVNKTSLAEVGRELGLALRCGKNSLAVRSIPVASSRMRNTSPSQPAPSCESTSYLRARTRPGLRSKLSR